MLLSLLLACEPASSKPATGAPSDTGAMHDDSGAPDSPAVETGPTDSATDSSTDSVPHTTDSVEHVGGADSDALAEVDRTAMVCELELDCDEDVSEDSRTPCTLRVVGGDGVVDWDGPVVASYRGRSSASVPKHSYAIELRDADGNDASANLLGMGSEGDWILNGLYYDRLLIRNKLGFDLFQSWGDNERWAPQSAFCELRLNGLRWGVYALTERIERDDDRIDIAEDDGTGGTFVMKQNDAECFHTNTTTYGCWKLVYPDQDVISEEAATWLEAYLDGWEAAVASADPYDEATGVWSYVDMDSLVDTVIIEELYKNEDAWYTSLHMWRDRDGKIHFTPWDLDMTFGQFPYYPYGDYDNPEVWINYRPQLMSVMTADPVFKERLVARWAELRADSLSEEAIFARMDELQGILGDAIDRNFSVWPIESINYGSYFYPVSSYEDEDAYVRDWIPKRLAWMDANIADY